MKLFPQPTSHIMSNQNTTHTMHLREAPFEKIKNGKKTIELRLFDEKRQKLKFGDYITFTLEGNSDKKIETEVVGISIFLDFSTLFQNINLEACGYESGTTIEDAVSKMYRYYSKEEENKYGVVGIYLQTLNVS